MLQWNAKCDFCLFLQAAETPWNLTALLQSGVTEDGVVMNEIGVIDLQVVDLNDIMP